MTLVVVFVFLRGPNGLIRIASRVRRTGAADAELVRVRRQLDSLAALRTRFSDTAFARRYAAELLGADPDSAGTEPEPVIEYQEEIPEPAEYETLVVPDEQEAVPDH